MNIDNTIFQLAKQTTRNHPWEPLPPRFPKWIPGNWGSWLRRRTVGRKTQRLRRQIEVPYTILAKQHTVDLYHSNWYYTKALKNIHIGKTYSNVSYNQSVNIAIGRIDLFFSEETTRTDLKSCWFCKFLFGDDTMLVCWWITHHILNPKIGILKTKHVMTAISYPFMEPHSVLFRSRCPFRRCPFRIIQ